MGAVDVGLQGGELVVKRVADKALRRQMIAFIRFDSPHDVVDAGETLERAGMQMDAVPDVLDSLQPVPGIFQGDTPDQAVDFVALGHQQL